ncbi:MAG: TauD/TfdA family dioxygenase [SAR86 cluster bacterium]
MVALKSADFEIQPLTGGFGASISGIRLGEIDDAEFEVIRKVFLASSVVVFSEQFLSKDEHLAFAKRWGEFSITPFLNYLEDYPGLLCLENKGKARSVTENWHYDSSFQSEPPSLTILSAQDVPAGGDTMWSDQYKAFEALSSGMQDMLSGVRAEFRGTRLARLTNSDKPIPSAFHPVVRTHPETGRKALFVGLPGETMGCLESMTDAESLPILKFLYEHSVLPDHVYRHRWRNGDVVMWDNRCTMHYAVHDYGDAVRELHRITIKGDKPV